MIIKMKYKCVSCLNIAKKDFFLQIKPSIFSFADKYLHMLQVFSSGSLSCKQDKTDNDDDMVLLLLTDSSDSNSTNLRVIRGYRIP